MHKGMLLDEKRKPGGGVGLWFEWETSTELESRCFVSICEISDCSHI